MAGERSGSNLLTRMLDAHPRCCGPSPVHALRILAPKLPVYGELSRDRQWHTLVDHFLALWDCKIGVWCTRPTAGKLRAAQPRSLGMLVRMLYRDEARAQGKQWVVVKEVGIEYHPAMLAFHRLPLTRRLAGCTDNWRNLDRPLMSGNTGRHRVALDREERQYVEDLCGELMARHGYGRETGPAEDLRSLEARLAARKPADKPQYRALAARERARRARWKQTVRAIRAYGGETRGDLSGAAA
jgi:hypothetical protein